MRIIHGFNLHDKDVDWFRSRNELYEAIINVMETNNGTETVRALRLKGYPCKDIKKCLNDIRALVAYLLNYEDSDEAYAKECYGERWNKYDNKPNAALPPYFHFFDKPDFLKFKNANESFYVYWPLMVILKLIWTCHHTNLNNTQKLAIRTFMNSCNNDDHVVDIENSSTWSWMLEDYKDKCPSLEDFAPEEPLTPECYDSGNWESFTKSYRPDYVQFILDSYTEPLRCKAFQLIRKAYSEDQWQNYALRDLIVTEEQKYGLKPLPEKEMDWYDYFHDDRDFTNTECNAMMAKIRSLEALCIKHGIDVGDVKAEADVRMKNDELERKIIEKDTRINELECLVNVTRDEEIELLKAGWLRTDKGFNPSKTKMKVLAVKILMGIEHDIPVELRDEFIEFMKFMTRADDATIENYIKPHNVMDEAAIEGLIRKYPNILNQT